MFIFDKDVIFTKRDVMNFTKFSDEFFDRLVRTVVHVPPSEPKSGRHDAHKTLGDLALIFRDQVALRYDL